MLKTHLIRLTIWYVIIVTLLSLSLSSFLFVFSYGELKENYHSQITHSITKNGKPTNPDLSLSTNQFNDQVNRLAISFIDFNLIVIITAGAISYFLAKRHIRPLEQANQAQQRFLAQASHELRTPITAMKLDTESIILSNNKTNQQLLKTFKSNLKDLSRLENLTTHLLEIAKYKSLEINHYSEVDLDRLIDLTLKQIKRSHSKSLKNKKIVCSLARVKLNCDKVAIELVVSILLDNAIKYSFPKSEINLSLTRQDQIACLSVSNFGPTINDQDIKHIFEPFYRPNRPNDVAGYGLGLSIAQQIIAMHKGKISYRAYQAAKLNQFQVELSTTV